MSDHLPEREYLDLLGKGDQGAFAALYEEYAGKCANFALALLKDPAAARDITHEVFTKVWIRRENISKVSSFNSYLFRMTRNEVLQRCRKTEVDKKYLDYLASVSGELMSRADDYMDRQDLMAVLSMALDKMPRQRSDIFHMSRMEGLSNKDIAEKLGISVRTVEKHISNALADIRKEIEENSKPGYV